MGTAGMAGKKTEEIKSKTDPTRIPDGAISQDERFVSAFPFTR